MHRLVLASAALVVLGAFPAQADRPVTAEEQTKLLAAVEAQGCSGGKMEFDDDGQAGGKFEVDDATCADGKVYDLKFDREFRLIKKKLD